MNHIVAGRRPSNKIKSIVEEYHRITFNAPVYKINYDVLVRK